MSINIITIYISGQQQTTPPVTVQSLPYIASAAEQQKHQKR